MLCWMASAVPRAEPADLPADLPTRLVPGVEGAHDPWYRAPRWRIRLGYSRCLVAPCLRAVRTLTCLERNERMIMKSRTLTISVVALAGVASGAVLVKSVSFGESTNAGYSSTASSATASPAPQSSGEYVFACV